MTSGEIALCIGAVFSSSVSQLFMKAAAGARHTRALGLVSVSVMLQIVSVLLAVNVLRTLALSQLIPFAASAYLLVPIGSYVVFKEQPGPSFWIGALLIVIGIVVALS